MPELQQPGHGKAADRRDDGKVGAFHRDDEGALREAVRGNAAGQDERHQPDAACRRYQGQLQRTAAQMNHLVDHAHSPHAGAKDGNRQGSDQHPILPIGKGTQGIKSGHAPILGALLMRVRGAHGGGLT